MTRSSGAGDAARLETLRIDTPEQYREAVADVLRLQAAREGTTEFARRQALRAVLHDYEMRHQTPEYHPGRPD